MTNSGMKLTKQVLGLECIINVYYRLTCQVKSNQNQFDSMLQ